MKGDRILDALPTLSEGELREIQARATALIGTARDSSVGKDAAVGREAVLDAVRRHLESAGLPCPPPGICRRASFHKAALAGAAVVDAFAREKIGSATRAHDAHLHEVLVRMLARWLQAVQVPVTYKNLCLNLEKVPAVVDRQFPGYRDSDLLHWILVSGRPSRV